MPSECQASDRHLRQGADQFNAGWIEIPALAGVQVFGRQDKHPTPGQGGGPGAGWRILKGPAILRFHPQPNTRAVIGANQG